MKSTLAGQLFVVLTTKEVVRFGKFLQSPYFNRRSDVLALFHLLARHVSAGLAAEPAGTQSASTQLTKTAIFAQVYPDQAFDRVRFNHLLTFFTERLEHFLACEELEQDHFQHHLLRCRAFRQRGLLSHFDDNVRELARDHAAAPYRNAGWWLFEYQLQNELFARQVLHQRGGSQHAPRVFAATQALSNFFLLENMRWSATARSIESLSGDAQLPVPLAAEIHRVAADTTETDNPALALTYAGLQALSNPDDEPAFTRLKLLLRAHIGLFPPNEARDLYMTAINCAIRRHNRGGSAYTREAFDLYREALTAQLLTDNGLLPKYTFINLLNLAQLVGEHAWARDFLEQGRELLPLNDRDNTYRYARAGYYFRRSEYPEVLALLREVDFSDAFIHLDARKMMIRSYYELGEWTALASLLDSFKAYLRRQKDLGYHRDSYLNLVKFTQKVIRVADKRAGARRKLALQIQAVEALAEREWLLEKLDV